MVTTTVALSLLAALLFAVSAALQQRAARGAARARSGNAAGRGFLPVLDVLSRLVRDRRWLAGWLANLTGFGLHATALHIGSLTVVQALLVTQLLFALALTGRRPTRRDWLGTFAICAGLAVLVTVHGTAPRSPAPRSPAHRVAVTLLLVGALIAGLVVAARFVGRRPQVRSALVAVAAGVCFCLTAVFVVLVTDDLSRGGVAAVLFDWAMPGLAVSTSLGGLLVQDAFAAGSLPTALTAMTIADPLASTVVGTFVFHAGAPPGSGVVYAVVGVLLISGTALIANSPTLHDERGETAIMKLVASPSAVREAGSRTRRGNRRPSPSRETARPWPVPPRAAGGPATPTARVHRWRALPGCRR